MLAKIKGQMQYEQYKKLFMRNGFHFGNPSHPASPALSICSCHWFLVEDHCGSLMYICPHEPSCKNRCLWKQPKDRMIHLQQGDKEKIIRELLHSKDKKGKGYISVGVNMVPQSFYSGSFIWRNPSQIKKSPKVQVFPEKNIYFCKTWLPIYSTIFFCIFFPP